MSEFPRRKKPTTMAWKKKMAWEKKQDCIQTVNRENKALDSKARQYHNAAHVCYSTIVNIPGVIVVSNQEHT